MNIFKNFNLKTLGALIKLMNNRKKLFIISVSIFFFLESLTYLFAISTQNTITSLMADDYGMFLVYLLLMVVGYSFWWLLAPIATYIGGIASKETIMNVKTNTCDRIIRMPMKQLDRKSKGELLSYMTNDMSCIESVYDGSFSQVLRGISEGASGMIAMFIIDWRFAIVVFMFGSIATISSSMFSKILSRKGEMLQEQLKKNSTNSYELIKSSKTIRLFKIENYLLNKISKGNKIESDIRVEIGKSGAFMGTVGTIIQSVAYIAMISLGALFVYWNISNWGTVIALIGLKSATDRLYIDCGNRMASMQTDLAGGQRILDLMNQPEESLENSNAFAVKEVETAISLQNVSFSYTDQLIIEDVNMEIRNNRLTALIGESGSGKSTIMKLILAMYEPKNGVIIYNGQENTSMESLRMKTTYVPQTPMLIRGTVYENIALGNEFANKQDIIKAAQLAGADVFIEAMENGYDTPILDDGNSLSGGQKQRIAIARALVKNAPVVLLDEITSSLDQDTAKQIYETIKNISKVKTVLIISHDLAVANIADFVYSIKGMRVECV